MKRMRKTLMVLLIVILLMSILFIYHLTNHYYDGNIIRRVMIGLNLVLSPTLIALVLSYLLEPLVRYLIHKFKLKRKTSIILVLGLFIVFVSLVLYFLVMFMITQGNVIYQNIQESISGSNLLDSIEKWFSDHGLSKIYEQIVTAIKNFDFTKVIGSANSALAQIAQVIATLILVPIFLWYFLNERDNIFNGITSVFPDNWQPHMNHVGRESNIMIMSYFKSKLISMIFLFFMFVALFLMLGMNLEYVLFFAILISVLDLIPYIGPFIGNVIPIIYVIANGGSNILFLESLHINWITSVIILLALNFVIQFIQGNIIIPRLAGKEMEINSLLILASMLFFGSVLGIWGIILSIPLCGILIVLIRYLKSGVLDDKEEDLIEEK